MQSKSIKVLMSRKEKKAFVSLKKQNTSFTSAMKHIADNSQFDILRKRKLPEEVFSIIWFNEDSIIVDNNLHHYDINLGYRLVLKAQNKDIDFKTNGVSFTKLPVIVTQKRFEMILSRINKRLAWFNFDEVQFLEVSVKNGIMNEKTINVTYDKPRVRKMENLNYDLEAEDYSQENKTIIGFIK